MTQNSPILETRGLGVSTRIAGERLPLVEGIDINLDAGGSLGIVGESGSGKSLTVRAIADLLASGLQADRGTIEFKGRSLDDMPGPDRRRLLGTEIAMIFQDPLSSLNPVMRIGDQIAEGLRVRLNVKRAEARRRAVELLAAVGIPSPSDVVRAYPHQFSGGMRQRVGIAIAIALDPDLVIADEPTTALDVTVASQILDLLHGLCRERGASLILISHDVRTVERVADRAAVMYAGRIVETGPTDDVVRRPLHPYTQGLLASVPPHDRRVERLTTIPASTTTPSVTLDACAFAERCEHVHDRCRNELPVLAPIPHRAQQVACFAVSEATA